MARNNVIDGLVGQLRQVDGFIGGTADAGTAVAYDHRTLAMGVDRAAIVLAGDRFEQKRLVMGKNQIDWYLNVEIWIRHNSDVVTARADADIYVGKVIERINANRTLGGSAFDALVTEGRIEDEKMEIGRTPYLLEVLTVKAEEHVTA